MPASRSPSRDAKPRSAARGYGPVVLIAAAAVLAVVIAVLPASMVNHLLPAGVHAEDFSGSLWHGSAGKITVQNRDAGAVEWYLHPASLLGLALAADLHWVKVGFAIDAAVRVDRAGFWAHAITGGGPIEDLRDLGLAAGWRGQALVNLSELSGDFTQPGTVVGDIRVTNLTSAQFADGVDLGGYDLRFGGSTPAGAASAGGAAAGGAADGGGTAPVNAGDLAAQLADTGGPLELRAVIRYAARERTVTVSGTVKERPDAPAALRRQLDNLSQLRGRDPQGRVPVEIEFAL
jgi:hypothetical protein